ncbi:MAG: VIT domain-containing protein [Anaerolineaceae bacterium]
MKRDWLIGLAGACVFLFVQFQPVQADGIIIPYPDVYPCLIAPCPTIPPDRPDHYPLEIKYHHVDVKINDQIAETHVDQVFFNPTDRAVEGTYIFPLPLDAAVSDFVLWVDGQPVRGEVLNAEEARDIYEDIVRSQMDPALLEYVGRGAVKASVFPIPAGGERRIELSYSQVLTADNGLVNYVYPLNTEKFSSEPLESVSVNVEITSPLPIRAVYSPSHKVDIHKSAENRVGVSYEEINVKPDTDFSLYYSIGTAEAFHLISYRDPGDSADPDGYFLALLAPRPALGEVTLAKDLILVLDRSGSMDGEKIRQAKSAVSYILRYLNANDRFQIITFSSELDQFASGLQPAIEVERAQDWVSGISAAGSTDINRALLEAAAAADKERPTFVIFLTDGLPTEGVQDTQSILDNFARVSGSNLRLFSFGVGYDVDTMLLDSISRDNHGLSTYIREGQNLDEELSTFYARISTPVLTDVSLTFDGITVMDIYPSPLPDLFAGNQVVILGRYARGGEVDVTLSGEVNGEIQRMVFEGISFDRDSREAKVQASSLPRLWATRRIGDLLSQIRLYGPDKEIIDHIVKLSVRFGIVTPYTSYLVTEDLELGVENQQRSAADTYQQLQAMPAAPAFGYDAVQKAADQGAMSQAEIAPAAPAGSAGGADQARIQYAGSRTFVLQDGVWVDTGFDPDTMTREEVVFLSPAYFELVQSNPETAAALALGNRMIILVDGRAVEITLTEETSGASSPPTERTLTPVPGMVTEKTLSLTLSATERTGKPIEGNKVIALDRDGISPWLWLAGFVILVAGGGLYLLITKNK